MCGRTAWIPALLAIAAGTVLHGVEGPYFVDRAEEWGLDYTYFNGMTGEYYYSEMVGGGSALFDYDGDGDLDVYFTQGHLQGEGKTLGDATYPVDYAPPFTDRLYRNDLTVDEQGRIEPRFVDVTGRSGFMAPGYGMGVMSGDYDNDGWMDLYVTNLASNHLLHNNGDGTFSDATEAAGVDDFRWSVPATFFDYDADGWLDLYVGNYVDFRVATHKSCATATGLFDYCGPLAYKPVADRLFRNRGDGTFENATGQARVATPFGGALGVVAADFNLDGWLDLYVANDETPNQMWINQGDGTFMDEALFSGAAVNEVGMAEGSMGVVAGDVNGDGAPDLFMTHVARETNTLYLNDGTGLFEDSSRVSGLGRASWKFTGFGTVLIDFDNDGWQDIFVANGAVRTLQEQAVAGDLYPLRQINQLYRNQEGAGFEEVTAEAGPAFAVKEVSRGVSTGDLDHDGDFDLIVVNSTVPTQLLVNQVGQASPSATFRLVGLEPPRDIQGAKIGLFRMGEAGTLWRRLATDGSYASANAPRALFGLGGADAIEKIRVLWPDRTLTEWWGLPAGRHVTLVQGATGSRP